MPPHSGLPPDKLISYEILNNWISGGAIEQVQTGVNIGLFGFISDSVSREGLLEAVRRRKDASVKLIQDLQMIHENYDSQSEGEE